MAQPTDTPEPPPSPVPTGPSQNGSLADGVGVIKKYLKTLPGSPGVYRMIDPAGQVLYVGKAKDLKKRVANYTHPQRQSTRIQRMIARTTQMEFITTHTEAEALLLEANLIRKLAPRYNILLRDDKSFPFIRITGAHDYPRILKHRGKRETGDEFFGPFAAAWAVTQTLQVLQRAFLLRTCSDNVFSARTRPCLLYQIKRCCAPCVDLVSQTEYADLVDQSRAFLRGDSKRIQKRLAQEMQTASDALEFEQAAQLRDRLSAMATVQSHQDIHLVGLDDADIIAAYQRGGQTCIQVFFYRGGGNFGNRAYFPSHGTDAEMGEVVEAFVGQFYANREPPKLVLLGCAVPQREILREALSVKAKRRIQIETPQRGDKRKLIDHATTNAREALARRLAENASQRRLLDGLAEILSLDSAPERIEVYDNSHISGTNAVGAMIVAGPDGFDKKAYRKFNIRRTTSTQSDAPEYSAGDDYGMMREVLTRRFARAIAEDPNQTKPGAPAPGTARWAWPDLLLIDGGKGQLSVAREVFADMGIENVALAAVAKGPDRNAGRERVFQTDRPVIELAANDPVLYFIQRLRDEAHRFAIGSHRDRRTKGIKKSPLDGIAGIGAKRKRALLHHFGSGAAASRAGIEDLATVDGISRAIAKKIHDHFNSSE